MNIFNPTTFKRLTIVIALAAGIGLVPTSINALSGSEFRVGRIIDDTVFFDGNAMSVSQIQSFLNSKVPNCDTNGTQNSTHSNGSRLYTRAEWGTIKNNPPPYVCLKNYTENVPSKSSDAYCQGGFSGGQKSAAQIIYDASVACSINPKVLIVLLQKEQSLVTDDWPWNIQYRSATGFGCPDTAACDTTYYGLFNQVYNAARQFQRYAKLPGNYNHRGGRTSFLRYNPQEVCGGTNVFMENQATAGLYNYTPYQPNKAALDNLYGTGDPCSAYGNRNFWRMWHDWFGSTDGQVVATVRHPDGTLVRSLGEAHVYLIIDGKRYHVPDINTFNSHGFLWRQVRIATMGDRELPVSGTMAFRGGTLIKGDAANEVFALRCMPTFCVKDHIASFDVFKAQGMDFSEVIVLPQATANTILQDKVITATDTHIHDSLVLDKQTGKVYRIDTGSKRWIPNTAVFAANHFFWSRVREATPADLALPTGANVDLPEGALVQVSGQPAVYAINQTDSGSFEKRHITTANLFAGFSYNFGDVFVIDASLLPAANGADLTE